MAYEGGSFKTTQYENRGLEFAWQISSQSIEKNETTIYWCIKGVGSASYWYESGNFLVQIDGETVFSQEGRIQLDNGTLVAEGYKTITHNTNGKRNFTAYVEAGVFYYAVNVSGSGAWDLKEIPRAATITSAADFTDEENPTIYYSNPAGSAVERLRACIDFDSAVSVADYRDISKTGSVYTFPLTDVERKNIRQNVVGSNSREIWFHLETTIGGEKYYSSFKTKKVTIVNAMPTLSPTIVDVGSVSTVLTGNDTGIIIKGYNSIEYAFNATAYKEATITGYRLTCGGFNVGTAASGKVYNADSGNFIFYITDSRGNTTSQSVNLDLIPYVKPSCNQSVKMELVGEIEAKVTLEISGNFYDGSFGDATNRLFLDYRIKADNEEWGSWIGILDTPTIKDNTYSITKVISGLNYNTAYTIQCRAEDSTGQTHRATAAEYTIRLVPVFDWGENDFNFNVPIAIQGNTLKDFVIDSGTASMGSNGTWYWEKWKSGKAVCYGRRNFGNMGVSTAWGSLYHSNTFSQNLPNGLFYDTPTVIDIRVISNSNYAGWVVQGFDAAASKSSTGSFRMTSAVSTTFSQVHFCFNVIGRWK